MRQLIIIILLLLFFTGCGQSGNLYLPNEKKPAMQTSENDINS